MKQPVLVFIIFFCFIRCSTENKEIAIEVDETSLRAHIKTLASDDFQGRSPFTEGETKTINYIKEQFEAIGAGSGNGDSYFQAVPMVELFAIPTTTMTVSGGTEDTTLNVSDDFVVYSEQVVEYTDLDNSELVFVGYGTVASEYDWNDYEGLDVKGKMVVVLVDDLGFASGDSIFFKGKTITYYSRWTYKYEEAARQGAAGCLIVHDTESAVYEWSVVANSWSGASLCLDNSGKDFQPNVLEWISTDAASKVFEMSDLDLDEYTLNPDLSLGIVMKT